MIVYFATSGDDLHATAVGLHAVPRQGEHVEIDDFAGTVERVDWRLSSVRRRFGAPDWKVEVWVWLIPDRSDDEWVR